MTWQFLFYLEHHHQLRKRKKKDKIEQPSRKFFCLSQRWEKYQACILSHLFLYIFFSQKKKTIKESLSH